MLNLYHVRRDERVDYDQYDSFVCVAESEFEARTYHPNGKLQWRRDFNAWVHRFGPKPYEVDTHETNWPSWTNAVEKLDVTCIGTATTDQTLPTIICASFNAG